MKKRAKGLRRHRNAFKITKKDSTYIQNFTGNKNVVLVEKCLIFLIIKKIFER